MIYKNGKGKESKRQPLEYKYVHARQWNCTLLYVKIKKI